MVPRLNYLVAQWLQPRPALDDPFGKVVSIENADSNSRYIWLSISSHVLASRKDFP